MSTLEQDLAHLNFEYLMLARECARNNLMEAAWRFGVDRKQIEEIAEFSVEHYPGAIQHCQNRDDGAAYEYAQKRISGDACRIANA